MPHGPGHCKGYIPGPYTMQQCRVCWREAMKTSPNSNCSVLPIGPQVLSPNNVEVPTIEVEQLPCIHLGPIIEQGAGCRCIKHVYDCEIHEKCKTFDWASKPLKCCIGCEDYDNGLEKIAASNVTIGITYWKRPNELERLIKSINQYLPGIKYIVEDTDGNLSAGRNRLYSKIQTPNIIVMEEDFVVLPNTAKGLWNAFKILDNDPAIWGVGGIAWEPKRGDVRWGHNFVRKGDLMYITASRRPMRSVGNIQYRPCDLILNWGVFRKTLFERVKWEEELPVTEHKEFFWRASRAGHEFAFYSDLRLNHFNDRPNSEYNTARARGFPEVIFRKHGFHFHHTA